MDKGTDFASLPREMAVKIFGLLSFEELKACVQVHDLWDMNIFNKFLFQVCRAWWDIGSSPALWRNLMYFFLTISTSEYKDNPPFPVYTSMRGSWMN